MTKPPRFHDCWLDVETFLREFARFAYDHLNMRCADDFDRLADRVIRKVADRFVVFAPRLADTLGSRPIWLP